MALQNGKSTRDHEGKPNSGPMPNPRNPMNLHEYMMSEAKTPRIESLVHPSPSPSLVSGSSPGFADFAAPSSAGFPSPFPTHQLSPKNAGFQPMPGPVQSPSAGGTAFDPRAHLLTFQGDIGDARGRAREIGPSIVPTSGMGLLAEASELAASANDKQNELKRVKSSEQDKLDNAPAWAEMKTKAGKERKRLPLACIACRRKKIRCSGEKPACKHCLRSRIPCVYKVTTRKAAPRTDYMAMLDKRLRRMEDRVIKLIPKDQQSAVPRAVVRPALPTPVTKFQGKKRAADEAFGNEPDLDKWARARSTSKNVDAAAMVKSTESDERTLFSEGAEYLPSKEIQEHLAEVYFDYVYGQSYPLLHKPSFMARLAAGNVAPVLVLAVCAISARFSNHPLLRTEPAFLRGEEWAKPAREIALKRWDTPNLTILIVYLLLGLHEFGTCHGGRSWMLAGLAQRMAFALVLHQDLDHHGWGKNAPSKDTSEISPTDREIRRRTMWACFLMDRFNASGTDRPMQMTEDFVNIPLPVREDIFQLELSAPTENLQGNVLNPIAAGQGQLSDARGNMGTAAYYIRIVALWGRLVRYWNLGGTEKEEHPIWDEQSKLSQLKKQVEGFRAGLPAHMVWSPENLQIHATGRNANQYVFLHLVYQQVRLFMNRWALPSSGPGPVDRNTPPEFRFECARAAIDAANMVSGLVKEALEYNVTAPFASYCAFYSSTVHVQGVFSKNSKIQEVAKQNLAHNVKYLTKMKKYWGMFHFVTENLKDLYRQHADAALRGANESGAKSGGILQYGDWFDKYPSGVSNIDYEDPAANKTTESATDTVLGQKSDLQSVEEFFATLSPVSRAAQLRKQARRAKAKKAAEKAATTDGIPQKDGVNESTDGSAQAAGIHDLLYNFGGQAAPGTPGNFGINGTGVGGADAMNLLDNHNPLIQPPMLSQMDRHMVLSSYAGMDPAFASSIANSMPDHQAGQTPITQDHNDSSLGANTLPHNIGGYDMWNLEGMGGFASGLSGQPLGLDSSTAWFVPWNMEPPTMSPEDAYGAFGADGFGGSMGGLGDAMGGAGQDYDLNGHLLGGAMDLDTGLEGVDAQQQQQ